MKVRHLGQHRNEHQQHHRTGKISEGIASHAGIGALRIIYKRASGLQGILFGRIFLIPHDIQLLAPAADIGKNRHKAVLASAQGTTGMQPVKVQEYAPHQHTEPTIQEHHGKPEANQRR